jgi:hypothetical protein
MNEAVTTILDMLHDAYEGGRNPKSDPPKKGLTKRVLYSAVRRQLEPAEFEMVMEEVVAKSKATLKDNVYCWVQHERKQYRQG